MGGVKIPCLVDKSQISEQRKRVPGLLGMNVVRHLPNAKESLGGIEFGIEEANSQEAVKEKCGLTQVAGEQVMPAGMVCDIPVTVPKGKGSQQFGVAGNEVKVSIGGVGSQETPGLTKGTSGLPNRVILSDTDHDQKKNNATEHSATGYSPFYLVNGRDARLLSNFLLGKDDSEDEIISEDWVEEHRNRLQTAYKIAKDNTEEYHNVRKKVHDKKAKPAPLHVGCRVLVRNRTQVGRNKIRDFWLPTPYSILEAYPETNTYLIQPSDASGSPKVVNRRDLKMYTGSVQGANQQKRKEAHKSKPETQQTMEDSDEDDEDDDSVMMEAEVDERMHARPHVPLRRSTRANAGRHSNPYNVP